MDRDCNKCVYSTREGGCRKFKCEGTKTVEDIRADARAEILKMVDWRAEQDIVRRKIDIHIDFAEILTTENVLRIIEEQLKQLEVNR